jgi:hypothetical protein
MYHDSYKFGKANQEELLRVAGFKNAEEFEGTIQSQRRQGFLSRVFSLRFRRKTEAQPAPLVQIHKPRSVPK